MNKFGLLLIVSLLGGCVYAGDNGILESRKNFFSYINGYGIDFYEDSETPQLVRSELISENNVKPNQSATAYRGYSVLDNKVYRKDYYQETFVTPNFQGALNSTSVPHRFNKGEKYKVLGSVRIDGEEYRLIPSGLDNFVFLIDNTGSFYRKMGQIRGSQLILLDPDYYPYPENLKMMNIKTSKTVESKPVKGFDLKYDGTKLDRIWFTYMDYSNSEKGSFENLSFPNKPGLIDINGIKFRILSASPDKLDYILL